MRVLVIVKATKETEAGVLPSKELVAEMGKFNEQLVKAGVMVDGAGLQSSAKGARIRFSGKTDRTVVRGPFPETNQLVAGYWIINVKSLDEAIDWMKRCPNPQEEEEGEIEIRQFFELEDFGASPAVEHHKAIGDQLAKRK